MEGSGKFVAENERMTECLNERMNFLNEKFQTFHLILSFSHLLILSLISNEITFKKRKSLPPFFAISW